MDSHTSMDNTEFSLLFTEELVEVVANLEKTVYNEIKDCVTGEDRLIWTQAGAAMAFIAMRNTLEYLKIVAGQNLQRKTRNEAN